MTRQILLLKKLKGPGIVLKAAKHNLRTGLQPAEHIDASRSADNVILRGPGTPHEVAARARSLMADAGVKSLRVDAVHALEAIVSLPPASGINEEQFFLDAVAWVERYFDGAPILSCTWHRDESASADAAPTPHVHILLLPLVDGRMIGSDLLGGFAKQDAMQAEFAREIGQRYGLTHQPRQERASATDKREMTDSIISMLKARHGLVIGPEAEAELSRLISANPAKLLRALAADMPQLKRHKSNSFVGIFTKATKPGKENHPGSRPTPPLEVEAQEHRAQAPNRMLCDGSASPAVPQDAAADTGVDADVSTTRHHDDDMPVDRWDERTGRMIEPRRTPSKREQAFTAVRSILSAHRATVRTQPETRTATFQVRCRSVAGQAQPAGP